LPCALQSCTRQSRLCCVLFDLAHGKAIFAVFLAIVHTAKVSRQNAADIVLRAGKFGGRGELCAGQGPLPCVRWGHTAKPRRYDGAVPRTPSGTWRSLCRAADLCRVSWAKFAVFTSLPCSFSDLYRGWFFAVFFLCMLPCFISLPCSLSLEHGKSCNCRVP
jgi:hypothetical protein